MKNQQTPTNDKKEEIKFIGECGTEISVDYSGTTDFCFKCDKVHYFKRKQLPNPNDSVSGKDEIKTTEDIFIMSYVGLDSTQEPPSHILKDSKKKWIPLLVHEKALSSQQEKIQSLEKENERLTQVHESELGVCQEYCTVVRGLQSQLAKLREGILSFLNKKVCFQFKPNTSEPIGVVFSKKDYDIFKEQLTAQTEKKEEEE